MSFFNLFENDRKRVRRLLSTTETFAPEQAIKVLKDMALHEESIKALKKIKCDIKFLYSYNHQQSLRHESYSKKVRELREEIQGL